MLHMLHVRSWLTVDTTGYKCKAVGKGTLFSTSAEGCKYENKSPFQRGKAQLSHCTPSSRVWTWFSSTGCRLRFFLDTLPAPFSLCMSMQPRWQQSGWQPSTPPHLCFAERLRPAPPSGRGICSQLLPLFREVEINGIQIVPSSSGTS